MTNYPSDRDTVMALNKLMVLVEEGLAQAWDPAVVADAKQQMEQTKAEFHEALAKIKDHAKSLEEKMSCLEQQQNQLTQGLDTLSHLQEVLDNWGGENQLRVDLTKIETFQDHWPNISEQLAAVPNLNADLEVYKLKSNILNTQQLDLSQNLETLQQEYQLVNSWINNIGGSSAFASLNLQLHNTQQQVSELMAQVETAQTIGQQVCQQAQQMQATTSQFLNTVEMLGDPSNLAQILSSLPVFHRQALATSKQIQQLVDSFVAKLNESQTRIKQWRSEVIEERQERQLVFNTMKSDFQSLMQEEVNQIRHELQESLSSLRQDMTETINMQDNRIRALRSQKCDRPFWHRSNWKRG